MFSDSSLMTKAVEQRGRWLDAVVQSIGDAVIAVDQSGHVTMLNPAAEVLTGWPQGVLTGAVGGLSGVVLNLEWPAPCDQPPRVATEQPGIIPSTGLGKS